MCHHCMPVQPCMYTIIMDLLAPFWLVFLGNCSAVHLLARFWCSSGRTSYRRTHSYQAWRFCAWPEANRTEPNRTRRPEFWQISLLGSGIHRSPSGTASTLTFVPPGSRSTAVKREIRREQGASWDPSGTVSSSNQQQEDSKETLGF